MNDAPGRRGKPVVRLGDHAYRALPVDRQPTPLDLLDCIGCAAILIDQQGEVVGRNMRADALLGSDLKLHNGRLAACEGESDTILKDLLRTALSSIAPNPAILLPPVMIRRRRGRPVVVQALPASGLVGANGEPASALLLLTCLDSRPELPETRLMLIFKLTPAEAKLAARLAEGDSLEEAIDSLHVSLGTARNQLKSIFMKTETNRQAELVALLWRVSDLAVSTSLMPSGSDSDARSVVRGDLGGARAF